MKTENINDPRYRSEFRLCEQEGCQCDLAHTEEELKHRWNTYIEQTYNAPTRAFMSAAERGELKEAQELYQKYWNMHAEKAIRVHAEFEGPFRWACQGGHLEFARWLKATFPNIKHNVWNNWAFRWACREGKLETAKWLWSLGGVNVKIHKGYARRWAEKNGHTEVVEWLDTLPPPKLELVYIGTNTRMCRYVLMYGECRRRECWFPHTVDELVPIECRYGIKKCRDGERCLYYHSRSESKEAYIERQARLLRNRRR